MDQQRARQLLDEERQRLSEALEEARAAADEDRASPDLPSYDDAGSVLTDEATNDELLDAIQSRLAALDRAEQRLADGTFGRSVQSGLPIPDERLEADPAAELTVEEAEQAG
jgi:DnaK suppressor protein